MDGKISPVMSRREADLLKVHLLKRCIAVIRGRWTITNHALIGGRALRKTFTILCDDNEQRYIRCHNIAFTRQTFYHVMRFYTFFLKHVIMIIELPRRIYWMLIKTILKKYKSITKVSMIKVKATFLIRLQVSLKSLCQSTILVFRLF